MKESGFSGAVRLLFVFCAYCQCVCAHGAVAVPSADFLNSIGTMSAISARGETLPKTIDSVSYLGIRWMREGIEGNIPIEQYVELHQRTGVKFSWGFGSGRADLPRLIETAKEIEKAGALLAFEGLNEPNNWGIKYQDEQGGRNGSWLPVAKLQRDLYETVHGDAVLKQYPVWSISEGGAEVDNVGLQFLKIPPGAGTILPAGTAFADFANVHNYIYHPNSSGLNDNKTWNAADLGPACRVDGLYGEYGRTWAKHFKGYSTNELLTLPRVTTETGATIGGVVTEEIHALNLLTMYLDQFKRGWSYTAVYLLRDRVDEGGNQKFAFFRPDYTPRLAGVYLHNLTTILADRGSTGKTDALEYSIPNQPETVHDLLLQRSDRSFQLVLWDERIKDSDSIELRFTAKAPHVRMFDPIVGVTPVKTLEDITAISLTLSNRPVVIEIPPRTAAAH